MDALEAARQAAAALHAAAVARGCDPRAPYALALAEADRLGIEVAPVLPDAAVLRGARAAFLAGDAMILHERVDDPFEAALLIAHEIGHAVLGDGGGACEIDVERPSEAAPVGTERVVEHSPRQRREVQMDLFAREFLLPRSLVRRLHVEDGLTAAGIAALHGAPPRLVAQQLLDALLLPDVVPPPAAPRRPPPPLNGEQRAAASHRGAAYLLGAGPGTGKTRTLAARVGGLLAEGVDPRRVLVVTFSNKAAGELSQRIAGGNADAFAAMWIGTFHALGLDVLRAFGDLVGVGRDPRLLDRAERVELLEDVFPRLNLLTLRETYDPTGPIDAALDAISRAQDELVGPERYAALAVAMLARASGGEERHRAARMVDVATLYASYDRLKRERGLADFGDLVMQPVLLMRAHEEVRLHYEGRFAHVLVDEYQDVNRAGVGLLKAIRPDGRGLWAVGDVRQSIYRWRGASSHNMALFGSDFPGAAVGALDVNYRSSQEIVTIFTGFSRTMRAGAERPSALEAARGPGGPAPTLSLLRDKSVEAPALAEAVERHVLAGGAYRDQCVLCGGNDRLSAVGRGLEAMGVPVLHLGSLFERDAVRDLTSILSLLRDPRGMGLVRTACIPEFAMGMADVDAALAALRPSPPGRPWWLDDPAALGAALSPGGAGAVVRLAEALAGFDAASDPWRVLTALLLDRTGIAARLASAPSVRDRGEAMAVWQFLNFLRAQPRARGMAVPRLLRRVRRLMRLADDRELRRLPAAAEGIDAVRLMTIHGSKGLEFSVVHLPGLNDDTLPRRFDPPDCPAPDGLVEGERGSAAAESAAAHDEEQECLLYVAMSRAACGLHLYACTNQAGGASRRLSRFVDRLGPGLVRAAVSPSSSLPPAPDELPVPVRFGATLRLEASRLAMMEGCPRRFFNAHVLRAGGAREATPYMAMHEAVRGLCAGAAAGGPAAGPSDVEAAVARALAAAGFDDAHLPPLADLARAMVDYHSSSRPAGGGGGRESMVVEVPGALLECVADEVVAGPDGRTRVRRVRTGHHRRRDLEDVGAAALVLAAERARPGAVVEVLHLADAVSTPVELTPTRLRNAGVKLERLVGAVRAGEFPTRRSSMTCPGCPALFVCDATPAGMLEKI